MIIRIWNGLKRRSAARVLRWRGASIGKCCWLRDIEVPRNAYDVCLADQVSLDRGVVLLATGSKSGEPRIQIGTSTYVNRYTMVDASQSIRIGSNCMIGPFCYITDHDHGTAASTLIQSQELISRPVVIEDDVWIGAHVCILKGVRLGKGSVIGAGSVVTKNVGPCEVVAGVPARVVSTRF